MKPVDAQKIQLWNEAEKALTLGPPSEVAAEYLRTAGLLAIQRQNWASALLRLEEAVRQGVHDLQTLDALGEAAYQTQTYSALLPFQDLYRDPLVAIHLARALMMLGQIPAAREHFRISADSLLKTALMAVLGVEKDIETAIAAMIPPSMNPEMQNGNCIEFWQALAPIAESAQRKDLVQLAERRLKALAYTKPVIHYNQSLRLLAEGEFRAGWKLYDWRLVPGSACSAPTTWVDFPMWEGEFLASAHAKKKLLVVMENGFGDQIFSLRYLHAMAKEAILEVAVGPELFPLVRSSFPSLQIHDLKQAQEVDYWQNKSRPDFWTYCLSIPSRTDFWEPLLTKGYLCAPENLTAQYRTQLANYSKSNPSPSSRPLPIYGITWHGDIRTAPMRTRAYSLEEFLQESQILQNPCLIVSLQKDATVEELQYLESAAKKANCQVINAAPTLQDFAHTAAWIRCSDHVWSCDTAVAHLAGALGADTTVLIRNNAIWHWRCEEKTLRSVWYDSCRIQYALTPPISYMFDIRPV